MIKNKTNLYVSILSVVGIVLIVLQVLFSIQARADQQKVDDITLLHGSIQRYSMATHSLPTRLDVLTDLCNKSVFSAYQVHPYSDGEVSIPAQNNPDTNSKIVASDKCVTSRLKDYEYQIIDNVRYELCTIFHQNTNARKLGPYAKNPNLDYEVYQSFDMHDSGKYCFRLKIDSYYINNASRSSSSSMPNNSSQSGVASTADISTSTPDGTLQPLNTMVADVMSYLITYKIQHTEYPESDTSDMAKMIQRYKYNFMSGGPVLNCPADAHFFSYTGYKNQSTNKMDTFELYFCDGSTMKKKTQADITWK